MDLREQQYFISIVEEGSISRAAQKLNISQSALSQLLLKLEQEAGSVLIRRARFKDPELTEAGRRYYECCRSMLFDWQRMQQDIRTLQSDAALQIRLGINNTSLSVRLIHAFHELSKKYPGLQVQMEDCRGMLVADKLLQGEFDIAVTAYAEEHPKLLYRNLGSFACELAVQKDHRLAKYSYLNPGQENTEIEISELESEPLILMLPETVFGYMERNWFIQQGFIPHGIAAVSKLTVLQRMIEFSGVSGLISQDRDTRPLSDCVVPVRLKNAFRYQVGVIWRKELVLHPAMQEIIDCLDQWR